MSAIPTRFALSAFVAVLLVTACGGSAEPPRSSAEPPADLSTVLAITVRNEQLEEARTWLWVEGQRYRLGSVRANQTETFYYPLDGIRNLHLEFDVMLGQRCITADRNYGPGEAVEARIPSNTVAFQGVCRRR
jgi:hypothetical protein